MSNGPIQEWKEKGIQIAAWHGEHGHTFSFQKRYQDKKTNEWKDTKYLFPNEIVILAKLSGLAAAWAMQNCKSLSEEKPQQAIQRPAQPQPRRTEGPRQESIPFSDADVQAVTGILDPEANWK